MYRSVHFLKMSLLIQQQAFALKLVQQDTMPTQEIELVSKIVHSYSLTQEQLLHLVYKSALETYLQISLLSNASHPALISTMDIFLQRLVFNFAPMVIMLILRQVCV